MTDNPLFTDGLGGDLADAEERRMQTFPCTITLKAGTLPHKSLSDALESGEEVAVDALNSRWMVRVRSVKHGGDLTDFGCELVRKAEVTALERLISAYREYAERAEPQSGVDGVIAEARQEQAELIAALQMHEWHTVEGELDRRCASCTGDERRGHDADCATGRILSRFPTRQ